MRMKMMDLNNGLIVGVDPGARGWLTFLRMDGSIAAEAEMPAVAVKVGRTTRLRVAAGALAEIIRRYAPTHAYVERVGAMPGQGTASCFTFGQAAGIVEGAIAAIGVPISFVAPAIWKRAAGIGADKTLARQRAMQLWPDQAAMFLRGKDDGRAESALIAWWGLQTMRAPLQAAA